MATPNKTIDEVLKSYVVNKRQRGVLTDSAFDKYVPKEEPLNPVVINGIATLSGPTNLPPVSDIEKIAKPVLTSWLKGKGGLRRVQKNNLWDSDITGGVTANEYWKRAKVFDDPTLSMEERLTKMIYGVETSGNPEAWRTTNKYGYMGRAQMGKAFMSDYGIDPSLYMRDPNYQHKATVNAVKKRIGELKGVYFRTGGKVVSNVKNHHGNSKKEDLLIVNPNNGSIYGAMRYNEIVFSQKDSNKIESLIQKGDAEKLGEFVASARAKHNDIVTNFVGGGKTKDPSAKAAIQSRIFQLDSLKDKMPRDLYEKYRSRILDSTSYSEVVSEYNNAIKAWSELKDGSSSQSPNAEQIESVKQNSIKYLKNLGVPNDILDKFKNKASKGLTLDSLNKYQDEAINEWTNKLEKTQNQQKTEEQPTQVSSPQEVMKSLLGGQTANKIQSDIDKIKDRRGKLAKSQDPKFKKELSLIDKVMSNLEGFYNSARKEGDDFYNSARKEGDDLVRNTSESAKKALSTNGRRAAIEYLKKAYIDGPDPASATIKKYFGDSEKSTNPNVVKIDATDARGNKYIKNPDGTYLRLGERKNYNYDPKTRRFNRIEGVKQALNPTPSRGPITKTGSPNTGGGVGSESSARLPYSENDSVKATQEYLNSFLVYNSAKQKGYTVGEAGRIFDENGKEVPIDKISSEAKNEQIDVDGKFGPETEAAIKIYNTANPDKQIKYSQLPSGRMMLENRGANTPDYLNKYYETGKVPRYGVEEIKPLTPKGLRDVPEIGIKEANPVIPVGPTKADGEKRVTPDSIKNLFSSENLQRVGSNIGDMAKMAALYRETGKPLPIYEQTEDWKKYTSMVENKANEGLNSAVQSQFNRDLNTNRALGYGQVVSASGGGGTQGAVLGALGNINQASANAIGQFAVADQAQRDINLSQFGQVARTNEQVNLSMYSQELQNAQNSRMQAASLIPTIKGQIEGRNDMYNAYGPGSSYQKLIQSQLEKQQAETDIAKRMAENPSLLFSGDSTIGSEDLISMADKSLIDAQKAKFGVKSTKAILR